MKQQLKVQLAKEVPIPNSELYESLFSTESTVSPDEKLILQEYRYLILKMLMGHYFIRILDCCSQSGALECHLYSQ